MAEKKSKQRSSNFTKAEEMMLVAEVEKLKGIIECKTTDKVNNHDKNRAWNAVTREFNAKGQSQQARSLEQLKSKYENLKTKARKLAASSRSYIQGTGGGPSHELDWDPVTQGNLRIINEKTVIGYQSRNDSDSVYPPPDPPMQPVDVCFVNEGNQGEEEVILLINSDNVDADPHAIEHIAATQGTTQMEESTNEEAGHERSSTRDWSTYTPNKLKTPMNQKLRQKVPISNSLQSSKEEYYKSKNILMLEEVKLKKLEVEWKKLDVEAKIVDKEDRAKKRKRDEEEHELKMRILALELELKQKELKAK